LKMVIKAHYSPNQPTLISKSALKLPPVRKSEVRLVIHKSLPIFAVPKKKQHLSKE